MKSQPVTRNRPLALRIVWYLVQIAVLGYAALALLMLIFQGRLIYYPTRRLEGTPGEVNLRFEDVTFRAADGVKLHGWFVPTDPPDKARGVVLLCHGNGGNISHRLATLAQLNRLGMGTLIFDYRGYGRSEGRPGEKGTYLDAEAAWKYLTERRKAPPERIVILGRSLGGAIAARLAGDRKPAAVIVESAFTSIPDLAAGMFWYLPARHLCRFKYATVEYIARVECPVLVVHSRHDELVPFRHGQKLFAAAPEPKDFVEITGSHNEGHLTAGNYERAVDTFLGRVLKQRSSTAQ